MARVDQGFITVVSGLPRSGTSMMMRMLDSGGLPVLTDGVRTADHDNPRGYYEFEPVKQLPRDASWLAEACNKAIKIIYIFLYHLPQNYHYKVLFLRRNIEDVLASQKVMLQHRKETSGLNDEQLANLYGAQLQRLFSWVKNQNNFEILYLDYEQILSRPEDAVLDISRFLGLPLDTDAMVRCVDPALNRRGSIVH